MARLHILRPLSISFSISPHIIAKGSCNFSEPVSLTFVSKSTWSPCLFRSPTSLESPDKMVYCTNNLGDYAVGLVLECGLSKKSLNEFWPAEFDANGFPRAVRCPLGNAFKIFVKEGDQDVDRSLPTTTSGFTIAGGVGSRFCVGRRGLTPGCTSAARPLKSLSAMVWFRSPLALPTTELLV